MKHSDLVTLSFLKTRRAAGLINRKGLLVLAAFAGLTSIGHGQVLINDQFNRTGALTGSAPTSSALPETWTAFSSITTDGTEAVLPYDPSAPSGMTGYMGIPGVTGGNLTVGATYTLSFTLTPPPDTDTANGWVAAGFGTETTPSTSPLGSGNDSGFFALYNNVNGVAIVDEVSGVASNLVIVVPVTGNANVVLTIQAGASSDLLSAKVNGTTEFSSFSAAVDPISQVFVGTAIAPDATISGNVQDLILDGPAVPEPRTWAMLLGGFGVLLFIGRLRHKQQAA